MDFRIKIDVSFDRRTVVSRMDRKLDRVMSATGSHGRSVMMQGMRPGGVENRTASRAGEYPRYHGSGGIRGNIAIGYDAGTKNLVIGPVAFARSSRTSFSRSKTVPEALNEGDTTTVVFVRSSTKRGRRKNPARKSRRRQNAAQGQVVKRTYRISPRPFVQLSMPSTAGKMLELLETQPL